MNKNKKLIIIGMLLFMVVFLSYVVYYEYNNIEVESIEYFLEDKIQKKLNVDDYKLLGIIKNVEEFETFKDLYNIYDDSYRDYRSNYLHVAVRSNICSEVLEFKKIRRNKDKFELVFNDEVYCGYACEDKVSIFEIPIDKEITDINKFKVVINYEYVDDENCENDYDEDVVIKKPVLYLYPEEDMNVKVTFKNSNTLLSTYPKYIDNWNVLAKKDGTLIDENGRELGDDEPDSGLIFKVYSIEVLNG